VRTTARLRRSQMRVRILHDRTGAFPVGCLGTKVAVERVNYHFPGIGVARIGFKAIG